MITPSWSLTIFGLCRICGSYGQAHRLVKLLFDENLFRKLVVRLAELYPKAAHLAEAGLLASPG